MTDLTRRLFLERAAALGAALAWAGPIRASALARHERRELFPEGVASGDPEPDSVILWTRRPPPPGTSARLTVEVAEDPDFHRLVATTRALAPEESDWTCRVLVAGLEPSTVYWYRLTDAEGDGRRTGGGGRA